MAISDALAAAPKHLDHYLAELTYRGNRRWQEQDLFSRLLVAALSAKPKTCKQVITGGS